LRVLVFGPPAHLWRQGAPSSEFRDKSANFREEAETLAEAAKSLPSPSPAAGPAEIPLVHTAAKTPAPARPRPQIRPVNLSTDYNAIGIYSQGTEFSSRHSIDQVGSALPAELLKKAKEWGGAAFIFAPPNQPNAVTSQKIRLPDDRFDGLKMLAFGVNGDQESQVFEVTYADGSSSSFTQSISDWYTPQNFPGESQAILLPYRLTGSGNRDEREFHVYGYTFSLDEKRKVRSLTLPQNPEVVVLAVTLVRGLPSNSSSLR